MPMNKNHILRFAIDLTEFMRSVSALVEDGQPPDAPRLVSRGLDVAASAMDGAIAAVTAGPATSIGLGDIGLDDMSLSQIIVELSQSRTNFKIWTPFDPDFKEQLKAKIPKHVRAWDEDERCWRISLDWFGNAQGLIEEHFPDIEVTYTQRAYRMVATLARQAEEEELLRQAKERASRRKKQRQAEARAAKSEARTQEQGRKAKTRAGAGPKQRGTPPSPPPPRGDNPDDPYVVLGCRPDAPDIVIKAAFKAQARAHHADNQGGTGDDAMMRKISGAYEKIARQRGWKNTRST